MKMMLSEFIEKLKIVSREAKSPKTEQLIKALVENLNAKGDIQIDLDHMCKALGVVI
jgi:fructose-1,6-bisphosphatase